MHSLQWRISWVFTVCIRRDRPSSPPHATQPKPSKTRTACLDSPLCDVYNTTADINVGAKVELPRERLRYQKHGHRRAPGGGGEIMGEGREEGGG